jgi:predicted dehydrogenase
MNPIKVGIVGCGNVSAGHLTGLKESSQFEVVAVADAAQERAQKRAAEFGVLRWCSDYQDIVADDKIEAVFVLTPAAIHAEISIAALRAGKHVFCEKPLAKTSDQCRAIQRAVEASGRAFLLGYTMRHSPDALNLKNLIRSGRLGRPVFYRDIWARCKGSPSPAIHDAELGGGVFYEHTHWIDFINFTFGPAKKVYASTRHLKPDRTTADDTFIAILDFASGDQAVWSESWSMPGMGWQPLCVGRHARPTLDVIGPKGSLHFPGPEGERVLSLYENDSSSNQPTQKWEWETDWGASSTAFSSEHKHFYECIRNGAQPICTAADGLSAVAVAEAIIESGRTGMPVFLNG